MHNYNFIISFLLMTCLLFGVTSCEDFIERYPHDSIASEEALASIEGVENTLNGIYYRMHQGAYNHRNYNIVGELMSDQMKLTDVHGARLVPAPTNEEDAGFGLWQRLYNDINRLNSILYYIDDIEGVSQERYNNAKGQALAMRGYFYFDLLKIYARPYLHQEPLVVGEPLGVVYRTEPFVGIDEKTFQARGTIEEGYQLVLDDLTIAEGLLNDNDFPYYFSKTAVKALLARLHLFMGNWQQAIDYSEDVIDNAPTKLVEAENYLDAFADAPGAESIFELNITSENVISLEMSVAGTAYWEANGPYLGEFILRKDLADLLDEYGDMGDVRSDMYFWTEGRGGQYAPYQRKFASHRGLAFWDNVRVIRMAEMYLIAAEAYAEMDELDDARDILTDFREHRMDQAFAEVTLATKEDIIDLILNERRVEFFSEMSHRWFDLRRRGMDIPKGDLDEDPGLPLSFEDYRVVDRIPEREIAQNPNMIQNPGY